MSLAIVVTGSIAFDDVVTAHGAVRDVPGGSALYFAAAASLFTPVHVVSVVGGDFPAAEFDFLVARGVDTGGIRVIEDGRTFRWAAEYEPDMNRRRTTSIEHNVFGDFRPVLSDDHKTAPCLFIGNVPPEIQLAVLEQVPQPRFTAADTIECYIESGSGLFREVIRRVDLLFINDAEAMLLTGRHSALSAGRALLDEGPRYVIVKKGEHGSVLMSRDAVFVVPAYPLETVVDPTGAGDSYAGGVLGYAAEAGDYGWETLKRAVFHGGVVASFACEDFSLEGLRGLDRGMIAERMRVFTDMTVC